MGVKNSQIPDLINHSLADFKDRPNFEAYLDLQEYIVCDYWFAEDRYDVQDGNSIEWRIVPDAGNGSFQFVSKFQVTDRPYRNIMQKASVQWCYAEAKSVYEARTMKEMRGKSELYNYLKGCYFDGTMDAVNGIELSAFAVPQSASDSLTPLGIPFWVNFLNSGTTDYTGQFGGQTAIYGDGSTTTSIGSLSTQTYTKHRNWAFNHSGINMQTMDAIRLACMKTGFKPPKNIKAYYSQTAPRFAIHSSIDYAADYERLVNAGPDNRNGDLNPFGGSGGALTFRGYEWKPTPVMDGMTYNPIYGVDRKNFQPVVHSDWWFAETEPMNDQDNPHVYTVQWDFQFNYALRNKRTGCWAGHNAF